MIWISYMCKKFHFHEVGQEGKGNWGSPTKNAHGGTVLRHKWNILTIFKGESALSDNDWRVPEVTWVGNNPLEIAYMVGE